MKTKKPKCRNCALFSRRVTKIHDLLNDLYDTLSDALEDLIDDDEITGSSDEGCCGYGGHCPCASNDENDSNICVCEFSGCHGRRL